MDRTAYVDRRRDRFLAQLQHLLHIPGASARAQHRAGVLPAAEWVVDETFHLPNFFAAMRCAVRFLQRIGGHS